MELFGTIIAVLQPKSGTSAKTGNTWMSQDFVIQTNEQNPKKCVFTVFGEDRIKQFGIRQGEQLTVNFDIDAHEYNGRWFNEVRAYNVYRAQMQQPQYVQQPTQQPMPPQQPIAPPVQSNQGNGGAGSDGLPF